MNPVYRFCRATALALSRAAFDYTVIHPERMITEGPVLICPNHGSFLDPPLAGSVWPGEVNFLARHTLYSNAFARWLFPRLCVVPIDQDRAGMAGLKTIIRSLQKGQRVMLFPEGGRSNDGPLQKGQPGAGLVASKSKAPVQPVRIFGAWEALPPGSSKVEFPKITIVIGEPIYFDHSQVPDGKEGYQYLSDRIMEAISALACPADRLPSPRKDQSPRERV